MDINKEVIFDYVSATLPERLIGNQREQDKAYELRNVFKNFFKLHDCQIKELDYATNNFKYEFVFSDFITLRCGGPYNDSGFRTCQLELKGEGCREFERLRPDLKWKDFFYFLIGLDARFKRIDTTIDLTNKKDAQDDIDVKASIAKVEKELGDSGRILVRESGTEPLIRVMVEAKSQDLCNKLAGDVVAVIKSKGYEAK